MPVAGSGNRESGIGRESRRGVALAEFESGSSSRAADSRFPIPASRNSEFAPRDSAATETLPLILCYHKIETRHELGITRISPRRFAKQMERLARRGFKAIGWESLLAIVRGQRASRPNEIVITFDDAYRGLRDHAFPVLAELGWPSLCFAITEYAGRLNRWDVAYGGRRFAHLTWRDMRKWEGHGVSFASHTVTHPRLTWVNEARLGRELEDSRQALAAGCDRPAPFISYPFGAARAREFDAARAAGYSGAFTLIRRWTGDPFAIPRLPVYVWSPPTPGTSWLAGVERASASAANRFAVGTSLLLQPRSANGTAR